jgi:hypothetical protein
LSELLPNDEPVQSLKASPTSVENHENDDAVTGTPWADRWVDLEPSQSPLVARRVRLVQIVPPPVPMISPHDVAVLGFIALILTLGTIGAMYRNDVT